MALAAYTGLSATGLLATRAWAGAADGEAQAFDFEILKAQAKQLAGKPTWIPSKCCRRPWRP